LRRLLDDSELRQAMGGAAAARTWEFGWDTAARSFGTVLAAAAGRPVLDTAPGVEPVHIQHDHTDPAGPTTPMAATP
jgi:hypothetical protein